MDDLNESAVLIEPEEEEDDIFDSQPPSPKSQSSLKPQVPITKPPVPDKLLAHIVIVIESKNGKMVTIAANSKTICSTVVYVGRAVFYAVEDGIECGLVKSIIFGGQEIPFFVLDVGDLCQAPIQSAAIISTNDRKLSALIHGGHSDTLSRRESIKGLMRWLSASHFGPNSAKSKMSIKRMKTGYEISCSPTARSGSWWAKKTKGKEVREECSFKEIDHQFNNLTF